MIYLLLWSVSSGPMPNLPWYKPELLRLKSGHRPHIAIFPNIEFWPYSESRSVITCFRVCVILPYLRVLSVTTCLNHSHYVCWVNNKIGGSFFIFPCDKWKTSRTFDLPACVFLSIHWVVALGSNCFWMALPCKCILLTKVIRADRADINTKDLGDCFGVQVGMVWCLGIKKTRELGLHY